MPDFASLTFSEEVANPKFFIAYWNTDNTSIFNIFGGKISQICLESPFF